MNKRIFYIILTAIFIVNLLPGAVFADNNQTISITADQNIKMSKGGTFYLTVQAQSDTEDPYKLAIETDGEVLSVVSGNSGIISSKDKQTVVYQINASSNAKAGNYRLLVKALSNLDEALLQEKELIIAVQEAQGQWTYDGDAMINVSYNLSGGDHLIAGELNTLTVNLYNRSTAVLRNASVKITLPEGMTIESGASSRVVGIFQPYESVTVSFPVYVDEDIEDGSYEITAVCSGEKRTKGSDSLSAASVSESFFVPVTGGEDTEELDVATPILMVSDYSYGGASVLAGSRFPLSLNLLNTSNVELRNIKIVISSDGTFLPVGSSSSFYIQEIPAGESTAIPITLSAGRDAEQGPHSLSISMSYEDEDKKTYSASDTVSVPIYQKTRLVIDDILDPGYLTEGSEGYLTVNYRNMGNYQINNLVIKVEGDFSLNGNNPTYYVGNMASGKSDYYSLNFMPNAAGPMNGLVTFTYEDGDGNEESLTKEFCFNISEMEIYDDPGMDIPAEEPSGLSIAGLTGWKLYAAGAVIAVVMIIITKIIKKHKAKKQEALELDE